MRSREEKLEFKNELEARTLGFSVRVFKLLNALPKKMIRTFEHSNIPNNRGAEAEEFLKIFQTINRTTRATRK